METKEDEILDNGIKKDDTYIIYPPILNKVEVKFTFIYMKKTLN